MHYGPVHYGLELKTAPAVEPRTLTEMKTHLRVDDTADDNYITALIAAARQVVENYVNRALVTQTWVLHMDRFPDWTIELPLPPLQSVTTIKYVDNDGVQQTLDSGDYRVDTKGPRGRIEPAWGKVWPSTRAVVNAVEIEFVAGYGNAASDVPTPLRQALDLICGQYYEHRENVGAPLSEAPLAARWLMNPYVSHRFGGVG